MKKQLVGLGIVSVLIIVMFSGCTQQESSVDPSVLDQATVQSTYQETDSIGEILEKTASIDSIYYEMTASINMSNFVSQQALMKIWKKGAYLKGEITSTTDGFTKTLSVIYRPEGIYMYNEESGQYELVIEDTFNMLSFIQYFDSDLIKTYLQNQTVKDFETEIIDGKTATIIEYTPSVDTDLIMVKVWIWNEHGLPLKAIIDMDLKDFSMSIEVLFSNYSFSPISDEVFSIVD
jgi:hypothetical protein